MSLSMRTIFFSLVFFQLFAISWAASANSGVSAILSIKKGSEVSPQELKKILTQDLVVSQRDLLSKLEQKKLKEMKLGHLAKVWVLDLKSVEAFDSLERKIRQNGLPLQLDWNDVEMNSLSMDPFSGFQWGVLNQGLAQAVDLDPVQNYSLPARKGEDVQIVRDNFKGRPIIVAVLDTGIQKDHPDLKNVIVRKESECQALAKFEQCIADGDRKACEKKWMDLKNPEVDLDGNGYPMDCSGWSLLGGVNKANIMGRPDFGDDQGHGTHVAGIIAAEVSNGIGVRGITQNVKILPVQVLGRQPSEPLKPLSVDITPDEKGKEKLNRSLGDLVARGVIYAMLSGADVINFSMGWPQGRDSQFMRDVIAAAQAQGIIIVAAAGNDATKALLRPCAYPGVLCVAAHGPDGALAHFSNYGGGVELAAPGLNILSTYPESKRPIRFRQTVGYEFLSGTSQASPYVAGAVAEMLARGVPRSEVVPRLMVSARSPQQKLNLQVGTEATGFRSLLPEVEIEQRNVSMGLLSLKNAMEVSPTALIVPASKERGEIKWDRRSSTLHLPVSLTNLWAGIDAAKVQIRAVIKKPHSEAVRPEVRSFIPLAPYKSVWERSETREYVLSLEITDAAPEKSRIASELEVLLQISAGTLYKEIPVEADITVSVDENTSGPEIQTFALENFPKGRSSFLPIDDNRDLEPQRRDYLVKIENRNQWQLTAMSQDSANGPYRNRGTAKLRLQGEVENLREQVLARMDFDFDGKSEWVLGLLEDKSELEEPTPSPITFYVFDQAMRIKEQFSYDSSKAQIPFTFSWMRSGEKMAPAWVGAGKDPERRRSLRDRWENPDNYESEEIRFYYLEGGVKLKAISSFKDYKIIDLLEGNLAQKSQGRVPVLLAKNLGSEAKPSYLYSFATAEIFDGKVESFRDLGTLVDKKTYRNILDTRVDKVMSLDIGDEEFAGTFWFGEGLERTQRLSMLNVEAWDWQDVTLKAERFQYDSALWVRAAFSGAHRKGAFVLTNSEIQYHDLNSEKSIRRSLERYTFYPDMLFTNLYFPLVLKDSQSVTAKLPAIFTTELSQLSRGVKVLTPSLATDGSMVELVSPAKMRLVSQAGCRPLETPVFLGGDAGYALDYFCGEKLLRIQLAY